MNRYTHTVSVIALLLLVLSMFVSACTSGEGETARTERGEGNTTTSEEKIITSGQLETEPIATTVEPTGTVADEPVTATTPAPTTTVVPSTTEASETTVPTTSTAPITTTQAPITTTAKPVTTTAVPGTTTNAPVTTTTAPVTTTNAPAKTDAPQTTKKPVTTEAPVTEAPHTHSYGSWEVTKAATCTKDGLKTRTCSCGKTETKTINAIGHTWESWTITKAPTETENGEEKRTCKICKEFEIRSIPKLEHTHSYDEWTLCDDYIYEEHTCSCGEVERQTHYAKAGDERAIADRVIYYINLYRAQEGTPTATKLPRLTLVAEMRSEQLVENYAHDTAALRECTTYYEYGDYMSKEFLEMVGFDDTTPFYDAPISEAIGGAVDNSRQTVDAVAKSIADSFHNSPNHWSYVGGKSPHIAVGIAHSDYDVYSGIDCYNNFYCVVFTCSTTEYE